MHSNVQHMSGVGVALLVDYHSGCQCINDVLVPDLQGYITVQAAMGTPVVVDFRDLLKRIVGLR